MLSFIELNVMVLVYIAIVYSTLAGKNVSHIALVSCDATTNSTININAIMPKCHNAIMLNEPRQVKLWIQSLAEK